MQDEALFLGFSTPSVTYFYPFDWPMLISFDTFCDSLQQPVPPAFPNEILLALWHDAKNDWHQAHEIAQSQEGSQPYDRLHAYLHRKEGDTYNANYWYRRANAKMPTTALEVEWETLVRQFLV
jgi:hypothetical protein